MPAGNWIWLSDELYDAFTVGGVMLHSVRSGAFPTRAHERAEFHSPTASPSAPFVALAHCLTRASCACTPLVTCCHRNASARNAELSEFIAPFSACQRRYAFQVSTGVATMSESSAVKYVGTRTFTG